VRRHFKPTLRRAGLPETVRFHDLRHRAAALTIAHGGSPKQVRERLGHSSIRITMDRYGPPLRRP
jgi:integrase